MSLDSFQLDIYSGQTATKKVTVTLDSQSSGQLEKVSFFKSVQDMYQAGILSIDNVAQEPEINDRVVISINSTDMFDGYVRSVSRNYRGSGSRDIKLIGKTYDLYRELVNNVPVEYSDDYTSNIIRDIVSSQTAFDYSEIPISGGSYISGTYDLQYFSVGEAIELISDYDNYSYYLDENDKLQYFEPSGNQKTISDSDLIKVKRIRKDDANIYNYVAVVGAENIYSIKSAQSSIDEYGKYLKIIRDSRIINSGDAAVLAQKYIDEYATPTYEGAIVIDGDESLILEQDIELNLSNLGISGQYDIKKLTHTITMDKGYQTEIDFGRPPYNPSYDEMLLDRKTKLHDQQLAEIDDAQSGKPTLYYQNDPPASPEEYDIWIDTDNDDKLYVYQTGGLGWTDSTNYEATWANVTGANKPEDNATSNPISVQSSEPSGAAAGDLWVDSDDDTPYIYDGTQWVTAFTEKPEDGTASGQILFWDGSAWKHTETDEVFFDDTSGSRGLSVGSGNLGDSKFRVYGNSKFGEIDNYLEISGSGQLSLVSGARVKKCVRINVAAVKAPTNKPADFVDYGITGAWEFSDATDDTVVGDIEIPDDMDTSEVPGVVLYWSSEATEKYGVWQLEYSYRKVDEDMSITSGQETLSISGQSSAVSGGLVTSEFTGVDAPDSDDEIFIFRLKRLGADAADTLSDTAEFYGLRFRYTSDKLGQVS